MQLTRELHQEIAELLADNTADTVIIARLTQKGIDASSANALIFRAKELRATAIVSARTSAVPRQQATPAPVAAESMTDIPVAQSIPFVNLSDFSTVLNAGDRAVRVVATLDNPNLVLFEDFLSHDECNQLVAERADIVSRSTAVDTNSGDSVVHPARTSSGGWYGRGVNPTISAIEERIARVCHWPVENGEGLQVLRYEPGQEYTPHFDYFDPRQPGTAKNVASSGNRVATIIMYLEEPLKGGGTHFPDAGGVRIYPKKGSAVFFSYDRPHESTRTRHAGAPVIEGVKWIATKWLREHRL